MTGAVSGAGTLSRIGGLLDLTGNVAASATGLQIDSGATLELDGTVATGAEATFESTTTGTTLELNETNNLANFSGTIAGLNVGSSTTTPTNEIDLANIAPTSITSAVLNAATDVITVTTASQSYNLQLSGTYAAGANVDLISDSHGGTDLFLDGSNNTIGTGTTNATAVAISGDFVNTNSAPVYIYEQTAQRYC